MACYNLLLILPDEKNERALTVEYSNPVEENVGFDEPQKYNDYFEQLTGIPVYRRYTFNMDGKYVVFVFEKANRGNVAPQNGFVWMPYDEITQSVQTHYNTSENMPWVNERGFSPYITWLEGVCDKKGIRINGKITQLKNAYMSTVFCAPTDIGNIYMKIPCKIFINEFAFTQGLKGLGIVDMPEWIDFCPELNAILMHDMGGNDLPQQSDIATLQKVLLRYAQIQKASISRPFDFSHYDNSIATVIKKAYGISKKEPALLPQLQIAEKLIQALPPIPNTIHHGDVRPGNIRVVGGKYIFYDWAWSGVSHPFAEIASFLHIIRRSLPDEAAKNALTDFYLKQWLDYGTLYQLKRAFYVLDALKYLFFAVDDYSWLNAIKQSTPAPCPMSADGWLLEKRTYYFETVLRRFIESNLPTPDSISANMSTSSSIG
ncbi:MAG: aminoglycoside phosphotransferase family protein [Defluviitaleaceae bacterium]|nr:aminoglycoside phosphotransferase family protein [Defluviitaleaceae bacterium]